MADASGRFLFQSVPAGSYRICLRANGYYEAPEDLVALIHVAGGQTVSVTRRLHRWAVLSGRVLDDRSEPVVSATVALLRRTYQAGSRLNIVETTETDDRGEYRFSMTRAGGYVIALPATQFYVPSEVTNGNVSQEILTPTLGDLARAGLGIRELQAAPADVSTTQERLFQMSVKRLPSAGRATLFWGQTSRLDQASVVSVAAGESRASLDFRVETQPVGSVQGKVVKDGAPLRYATVRIDRTEFSEGPSVFPAAVALSDSSGFFEVADLPSGMYRAAAVLTTPSGASTKGPVERLWGAASFVVETGKRGRVEVAMTTGVAVQGRIRFQGALEPPTPEALARLGVALDPADTRAFAASASGRIRSDGTFEITDVIPGRYTLRLPLTPRGWFLAEARLDGADISDVAVEVGEAGFAELQMIDTSGTLEGVVKAADGKVAAGAYVLVFPADSRHQSECAGKHFKTTKTDPMGTFRVTGVSAATYLIVAVTQVPESWTNPSTLKSFTSIATKVELPLGELRTVDVRLDIRRRLP